MEPISSNSVSKAMNITSYQKGGLKSQTRDLAIKQVIEDVTKVPTNDSISIINPGQVINSMQIPRKITITVTNGSEDTQDDIRIFNNDTYEELPAGVTVAYSDGFAGKLINKLIGGLLNANGLFVFGFNVTGYDSEGIKSDDVVNSLALTALFYTGVGKASVPGEIELAGEERNDQFKDGLLTVKTQIQFNFLSQLKMNLGAGEKVQFVFSTVPLK